MSWLLYVLLAIFIIWLIYKILKPYIIHYDTTLLFCGGLGSGKSLNSVKYACKLLRKNRIKVKWLNFKIWVHNKFNKNEPKDYIQKPLLYSNLPVIINKKEMSSELTYNILTLNERIREYSVVLIDELPVIVNQYNWNIQKVQGELNEFITFFRHYVGGYLIVNGQAESEIVKQIRSKLNSYYRCFDFQKFLCFYRVRLLHSQISENDISLSSEFVEDNTKWNYGIITKKYNSRCYSERYKNIKNGVVDNIHISRELKTNKLIRFNTHYKSPCDDPLPAKEKAKKTPKKTKEQAQ